MSVQLFTDEWEFRGDSAEFTPVTLPHDAMIAEVRTADAASWAHGGYFPGGRYRYRKSWTAGPEVVGKLVSLRFEGVYRHSTVRLDGQVIGVMTSGYREFSVALPQDLAPGEHNIEVEVDNLLTPNARWYTGSGIYRPVWLEIRDVTHLVPGGISLTTTGHGSSAQVTIDVQLNNPDSSQLDVTVQLGTTTLQANTDNSSVQLQCEVSVEDLWSAENPTLHPLTVTLSRAGEVIDEVVDTVGLRWIERDPTRGLLVNGEVVKLRGANIHHDQGVIGAATFTESEYRRIRLLKEAGYNAIRSAHNPASHALLAACDFYGMYVMDEAYDGWYDHKNVHDDADFFEQEWPHELDALVAKNRFHPSVIMYSIGNENGEAMTPRGRTIAHRMTQHIRALDPTTPITLGVNMVGAGFAGLGKKHTQDSPDLTAKAAPDMTSTAINIVTNRFGFLMTKFPRFRSADTSTRELFNLVDLAGYNYGNSRYDIDTTLHPERLIVGTETIPGDILRNWNLITAHPTLIGDFMWAGWDYMGEAGAGTWAYGTRRAPFMKAFPQLVSGMGVFDITGVPGSSLRLAQVAWGTLESPAIGVRPLDVRPGPISRTAWRFTDAIESWSWAGHEGERAELEIYSRDEQIELRLNGRSLGRRAVRDGVARFKTSYEPGTLTAIGYRAGARVSQSQLTTAGPTHLTATVEPTVVGELAYVRLELADADGVVNTSAQDVLSVHLEGPATLQGFGNAAPATEESFADATHSTYRGRALAVIRSTGEPGPITLRVDSTIHGQTLCTFTIAGEK